MSDIGNIAGLPDELGVGEDVAKEGVKITVTAEKRRFGKMMTIVSGLKGSGMDLDQLASKLKSKLACGGTVSDKKEVLLQGDHRKRIKKVLAKLGFNQENIKVK